MKKKPHTHRERERQKKHNRKSRGKNSTSSVHRIHRKSTANVFETNQFGQPVFVIRVTQQKYPKINCIVAASEYGFSFSFPFSFSFFVRNFFFRSHRNRFSVDEPEPMLSAGSTMSMQVSSALLYL